MSAAMLADRVADRIDALLPQTQCQRCGYPACRPYAEAIERGEADINQCPPGGDDGIAQLAALLGRTPLPMNPVNGVPITQHVVAVIDESRCIGCVKCIQACPVDAIVGAAKLMHTVIADECSGCELCIAPCPVDCIEMVEAPPPVTSPAAQYRARYDARQQRLQRLEDERRAEYARRKASLQPAAAEPAVLDPVARALAAARARSSGA